jgi:anti-sigma factor RsiW
MTDHTEFLDRFDDFLKGELPPAERLAVAEHLKGCDPCRAELEGVVALRAHVRALPREIAPPRDLWPEIAARLRERGEAPAAEPADETVIAVDFRSRSRRPAWRRWAPLAAAAMVLVVLSSGITAMLMRARGEARVAVVQVPVPAGDAARPTSALAAFRPTEREYLGALETLEGELAARRDQLSPQTIATIEENLRIIDQAIAETRAALESDPGNAELPLLLSGVYRKKVELLQSAIQIPARSI